MSFLTAISWSTLALALAMAVWQDVRYRRIPNRLLLPFAGLALVLALWPQGIGLNSALVGGAIGGAAFLPMYLLRQMGAGDIKLMATAGLLVGTPRMAALCLSVAMAGGLLALFWVWRTRRQRPAADAQPRMPYAVAIALGSAAHGLLIPLLTF